MSAIGDAISEAGQSLGLAAGPAGTGVFGELDGRLVQISPGAKEAVPIVRVRIDDVEDKTTLLASVAASQSLADADVSKRDVTITHEFITYVHPKSASSLKPETLAASARALGAAVTAAAGRRTPGCRMCKGTGSKPVLVGADVDRLCDACVHKMTFEAESAQRTYDATPMNVPMALLFGLVCAVVGALAWGGICILTGRIFWFVGCLVGVFVGWGTLRGAARGGLPVQIIGGALTMVSVLAGQLMYLGHYVQNDAEQRGESVPWGAILSQAPDLLMSDIRTTAITLIAGLGGAWVASKMAGKQQFKVDVHQAGTP